jgi:hypothetical protein
VKEKELEFCTTHSSSSEIEWMGNFGFGSEWEGKNG